MADFFEIVNQKGEIKMDKVKLGVKGMSCHHCVKTIEGSVGNLEGVSNVKVDLKEASVDVEYNEMKLSLDQIKEVINSQGYHCS